MRSFLLLSAVALLTSHGASARSELPFRLTPASGVSAQVEKQGQDYVLVQPDGQPVALLAEDDLIEGSSPIVAVEDYNYDGHPDLSLGLLTGMVNIAHALYLYDPHSRSYISFEVPDEIADRQNCAGFWDIERLPARKAIQSNCRGGARWHYDILQIEPDHSVWISEQSRVAEDRVGWPYFSKPMRAVTYDRQGHVLSETVMSYEEGAEPDASWNVPVERLELYTAPAVTARTNAYLIGGDETRMLAFDGDEWMKIAYGGRDGRIERWVSLKDAYDLSHRYDPKQSPKNSLLLVAMDYSNVGEDEEYYRNLFTLFIGNRAEGDVAIYHGEIHLVFTNEDGVSVSHKLYDLPTFTLRPGEDRMLDDNALEHHDGRYVIFHGTEAGSEYVPFFPAGIRKGRYRMRPVLTAPALPNPVYAAREIELEYPPRLPANLIQP